MSAQSRSPNSHNSGAEIILTLKNKGAEAYKHDVYGDKIIIERKIGADGGGSWKIKSGRDGKSKSTKREELDAICDHLDIQASVSVPSEICQAG